MYAQPNRLWEWGQYTTNIWVKKTASGRWHDREEEKCPSPSAPTSGELTQGKRSAVNALARTRRTIISSGYKGFATPEGRNTTFGNRYRPPKRGKSGQNNKRAFGLLQKKTTPLRSKDNDKGKQSL